MPKSLTIKFKLVLIALICCCVSAIYFSNVFSQIKWKKLSEDTHSHTAPFLSVAFFDSGNGIAITSSEIKETVDSGKTWRTVYENEDMAFDALFFSNGQTGWVVGSDKKKSLILKTDDKGLHWQKVEFDNYDSSKVNGKFTRFFDICFSQFGKSWIVGDGGVVEVLTNGLDWKISNIVFTKETLLSVSCSKTGEVWAVGENSAIFHYRNGWARKKLDDKYLLTKVKLVENSVWILGGFDSQGILLKSQDGGESWENKTPESANILFDVSFEGTQDWLVGTNGNIFNSSDSGNSWTKSESPTKADLLHIFSLNTNNVWISGDKATILKYQN